MVDKIPSFYEITTDPSGKIRIVVDRDVLKKIALNASKIRTEIERLQRKLDGLDGLSKEHHELLMELAHVLSSVKEEGNEFQS